MRSRVGLWGGSCAIRLPKMAVESLGLHEGEAVNLQLEGGALVIRPAKLRYALDDLVEEANRLKAPEPLDDAAMGEEAL